MLYAKISPSAKVAQQETPFTSIIVDANYMTAIARPYVPGSAQTNFEVIFGNEVKNSEGVVTGFQSISNSSITLTSVQLAGWGTNDDVMLSAVATAIGTTATEFVTIDNNQLG